MDFNMIVLVVLFIVAVIFFFLRLKLYMEYSRGKRKIREEVNAFLKNFNLSDFCNYDMLEFQLASFSHVSPFPKKIDGEWRYIIYLAQPEATDTSTIVHEIVECTIGRVIEKLLQLKKPLYLLRKHDGKFWVTGQQQKYVLEHLLTAMTEFNDIPKEKQEERVAPEDIKKWQLRN